MVFSLHHTAKTIKMRSVYNIHKPHYIANTILLPFDIKIVRQVQKQRKMARLAEPVRRIFGRA